MRLKQAWTTRCFYDGQSSRVKIVEINKISEPGLRESNWSTNRPLRLRKRPRQFHREFENTQIGKIWEEKPQIGKIGGKNLKLERSVEKGEFMNRLQILAKSLCLEAASKALRRGISVKLLQ